MIAMTSLKTVALSAALMAVSAPFAMAQSVESSEVQRQQAERRARKAQTDFDAVALQALITPMFSGMKDGPLGSGNAGRYWQALMSEQVARQIASSGRLRLLAKIPNTPDEKRNRKPATPNRGKSINAPIVSTSFWKTSVRSVGATTETGRKVETAKED